MSSIAPRFWSWVTQPATSMASAAHDPASQRLLKTMEIRVAMNFSSSQCARPRAA
jgi:hypothetical protein